MTQEGHRLESLAGIWPVSNSAWKISIFCVPIREIKKAQFLISCCSMVYPLSIYPDCQYFQFELEIPNFQFECILSDRWQEGSFEQLS